ncbi:hypothetical protein D3821_31625 [Escherichia coli]|nr:hypothetical protein D3821_31625 [Escherichia coli]
MPAFEWVHVQLHQQKGMISLSPPTICNSARLRAAEGKLRPFYRKRSKKPPFIPCINQCHPV